MNAILDTAWRRTRGAAATTAVLTAATLFNALLAPWAGALMAVVQFIFCAVLLTNCYLMGKKDGIEETNDLFSEAVNLSQNVAARYEALSRLAPPMPTVRCTGGGPMDGADVPYAPPEMWALLEQIGTQTPTKMELSVHEGETKIGTYVLDEDDPTKLVWQEEEK